jgi:Ca-activated chloride channel family protein
MLKRPPKAAFLVLTFAFTTACEVDDDSGTSAGASVGGAESVAPDPNGGPDEASGGRPGRGEQAVGGAPSGGSAWSDESGSPAADAGFAGPVGGEPSAAAGGGAPPPSTNIGFSGSQDFGSFRRQVEAGSVPSPDTYDEQGFFAEHHTPLPPADCGERVCAHAMLGTLGNLLTGENCTILQIGLNSPIVADPDNRPPLNLSVVVDVSGSMSAEGRLDFVRLGLEQMVNALSDTDEIALVTYSNEARVLFPMAPVRGNRNTLDTLISGLQPDGSTNLYDGLEKGYREAFEHYDSGRQNRVILLSDGEPTAGNTDVDAILDMSGRYNGDGVGITSVGLGSGFNYTLMKGIADQGDGNFYFVENADAVQEVFTEEISYFTVPVAFDLEVRVRGGADFAYRRAFGATRWTDDADQGGGGLELPSVFLAHRVSHADQTPGGGRRGGGSALLIELMPKEGAAERDIADVATVEFRFREPGTNRVVERIVPVRLAFPRAVVEARGHFDNPIVMKSFVMLNIYTTFDMAVSLVHGDRAPDAALALLRRVIAAVRDYLDGQEAPDQDIESDLALLVALADLVAQAGSPEPAPESIPEDPWPCD